MPYLLPKLNFQLSAELFWYFPKDWINQLNEYEATSDIQNTTAKRSIDHNSEKFNIGGRLNMDVDGK